MNLRKKNTHTQKQKYDNFLVIWNSVANYYSYDSFDSVRVLSSVRFVRLRGWILFFFFLKMDRNEPIGFCRDCLVRRLSWVQQERISLWISRMPYSRTSTSKCLRFVIKLIVLVPTTESIKLHFLQNCGKIFTTLVKRVASMPFSNWQLMAGANNNA